ncbi:chemotaxis protein CheC [Tindallia californiensis]|uniref:Chemotaxis protein CheC n=1 Tax=Tindallia californiensis TaxID=159292 RepID=A0A1H3NIY6_9FIRM|nr:chemotaxis protein CheC [Tindallia californiensis]SDY88754.1 chemotaxis protein CheC [Tindallia californiensis]
MLNELQKEALREHMNIYVGQAASLLSDMLRKKITLTTPELFILSKSQNDRAIYEKMKPSFFNSHVVVSTLKFGSVFSGNAQLIFPRDKSQWLVKLVLGEIEDAGDVSEALAHEELTDTDFDAIREIGNVILNSIVGALGNLLEVKLDYSLPEVQTFFYPEQEGELFEGKDPHVLIINNSFSIEEFETQGAILIVLGLDSIVELTAKINEILLDLEDI